MLVARESGRHRRRWIGALAVVALLAAGGFALVHSSVFGARHVEVTGDAHVPVRTVIATAGLATSPPLVDLSPAVIASRVEALPWVDTAKVELSWPSTVRIHVTDRVPVAVTETAAGAFDLVDRSGRVLATYATRPAGFPEIEATGVLPAVGHDVSAPTRQLAAVAAAMPESMVAEVRLVGFSGHEMAVALDDSITALLGDPSELADKFVALATVLAHGALTGIKTIDLRVPSAPVLIRKPSSPIVARNVGG